MRIETERLVITKFSKDMAYNVHLNSLDEDTRRFLPDEVFETEQEALETIEFLISQYGKQNSPLVYPILLKSGENIGYVQLVPLDEGWEVGYHIAKRYTKNGYATEAVKAFLKTMVKKLQIQHVMGITLVENKGSIRVLEKCGFQKVHQGLGMYQGMKKEICSYVYLCDKMDM